MIDGGSTDGTLQVLQGYADRLAVLVSEPDRGIYDALNKGIARASGEVVGFLHSDDLFADAAVLSRIGAAFADPDVDAAYGDLLYVSKDDPSRVVRSWRSGAFTPARLARAGCRRTDVLRSPRGVRTLRQVRHLVPHRRRLRLRAAPAGPRRRARSLHP